MKNHYKFLLALLGAATLISCSSEVSEQRPDTSEVEEHAEHPEPLLTEPMQEAQVTDAFALTFANDVEERNKWAVETRTATVDGVLPEEMLYLEVLLPDGTKKSRPSTDPIIIKLPKAQSVAKLTLKWKVKQEVSQTDKANENDTPRADTKLVIEQHLQITIGGGTIPAKMDKILERDSQLMKKYKVEFAKLQNAKKQRDSIQNEFRKIQRQPAGAKRLQALTHLEGLMAKVNLKLARHNRLAGKWKNTILGAAQFGAQVLRPAKGKAFHYRLYLQRESDGKQIDLMRSLGFSNAIVDPELWVIEESSVASTEEEDKSRVDEGDKPLEGMRDKVAIRDSEGVITPSYSNGQKRWEQDYQNGRLISASSWRPDGERCPITEIVDGSGVIVVYHENGRKAWETHYKNGKLDGHETWWDENGRKEREIRWINGQKLSQTQSKWVQGQEEEALSIDWHENGQKASERHYEGVIPDGRWTEWDQNGQKTSEVHYLNGKMNGLWTTWDKDGNKTKKVHYQDGKEVSRKEF